MGMSSPLYRTDSTTSAEIRISRKAIQHTEGAPCQGASPLVGRDTAGGPTRLAGFDFTAGEPSSTRCPPDGGQAPGLC